MKARESGMPEEDRWNSFFNADCIVEKMECAPRGDEEIVEFGSGYGTFTLPVARRTGGLVHALEIETHLVRLLEMKAREAALSNISPLEFDFIEQSSGLSAQSVDHVMLYNILHLEQPVALLRESLRILKPGGTASIIHWIHDPATPRGPSMDIRPTPEDCRSWAEAAGFRFLRHPDLSACCNFHYGLLIQRPFTP
jgi:ubiquinone/menaquinone biosynthesis C-methylase UbiE